MVTGSRVERKKYRQKQYNKTPKRNYLTWLKRILIIGLSLGLVVLIAGASLFTYYAMSAPEISQDDLTGQVSSKVFDHEGNLVKTLGGKNRELMTPDQIPDVLKEAVLAIEDARFMEHKGVDPIRIVGAALANLKSGDIRQGGSTITQQLVKLSVFSTKFEDQTLERKAQEAWLSLKLEQEYSKEEILSLYLNKLFYSNNVYGAKTAARTFFSKELKDLTLAEAALLAGLPQAPTQYDPYLYPDVAQERRDTVLQVMLKRKLISQAQYQQAIAIPVSSMLTPLDDDTLSEKDLMVDAYIDVVAQEVQDKMNLNVYTDGLEIYTNLDLEAQKHLYQTVQDSAGQIFPNDKMQTAVSIINVDNGQITALSGGRNQEVAMGLNRTTTLNRSIGSTMKPLADYGPAIEYLNYSTGQTVVDEPYQYSSGDEIYNYDMNYKGKQTLREALVGSRNIPALKLLQEVGLDKSYSFLQKMDINIKNNNQRELVESNAIGGEMTPIQLAAAYATIANYGNYYKPYTVNKVVTQAGTIQEFQAESRQAMKDSTAYMLIDILKGVPGTFAEKAAVNGLYHAGKTGTTNYSNQQRAELGIDPEIFAAPDAWYAGFTPQYAIATWVGYDDPYQTGHQLSYQDSLIPQMIYQEMIQYLMQDVPIVDWQKPDSVEIAEIEKYTQPLQKPSPQTPANMRSNELFVKGTQPTQISPVYKVLPAPTGFDAEYNEETQEIEAKWDPLTIQGTFELSLNGNVIYIGTDTEFKVEAPAPGYYELGLRIVDGYSASDRLMINFDLSVEETSTSEESTLETSETTLAPDPNNPNPGGEEGLTSLENNDGP
ncbi:transglycosylase domain-containing protein [Facklamia miroungae]|uniref:Penicillin-binding protein 1A n=1 Tax=Facklamia miroungae TaxID=120956 RepID=A0A1G7PMN9_9LACT|nr:PBP1A family penicillin-binding protein [Facklamia miroungae]NKZ28744.1 PBP1A family penicillin-binding protein [Facklamia miroungae]SDF86650.1 penicillin-binding protein 1A [Facklamia miroungae]